MSLQKHKKVVRQLVDEVWNEHQLENLGRFVAGNLLAEATEHTRQFLTAFPDVQVTIEDMIAEGDKVVGRLLVSGTNTGPFAGRPPTGKRITFASFRIYRLANGRIVESWAMQDRLGLMEQLGFVQSAGSVNWAAGKDERSE
jgi:predicted ester cyclase